MSVSPRIPYHTDEGSVRFWQGCRDGQILLKRCRICDRHHFYPRRMCPFCGSKDVEWVSSSGRGTIYSYTVMHRAPDEYFKSIAPYIAVVVELEEHVRLCSWIVGVDPDEVRIGLPIRATFVEVSPDVWLHQFVRDESDATRGS